MHRKIKSATKHLIFSAIILFCASSIANSAAPNDSYIAGYAAGILKANFNLEIPSLIVNNGVITVPANDLVIADRVGVLQRLSEIPGVTAVTLLDASSQPTTNDTLASTSDESSEPANIPTGNSVLFPTGLLPTGHLFKPLLADPGGHIFQRLIATILAIMLMGIIMGRLVLVKPFHSIAPTWDKPRYSGRQVFKRRSSATLISVPNHLISSTVISLHRYIPACEWVSFPLFPAFITKAHI